LAQDLPKLNARLNGGLIVMAEDFRTDVYSRGSCDFMGVKLKIGRGVLIPREETELLGHTACGEVQDYENPKIIDMCAGCGNLACALAVHIPAAKMWAADASPECVSLISANVQGLGLRDRVTVVESDLFESLRGLDLLAAVDLIVCNPPYIPSHRLNAQSRWLLESEPRRAFDGGPYGVDILRRLVREAAVFLREDGSLIFEFGEGQHEIVRRLLESSGAYHSIRFVTNGAGIPRVAVARKKRIPSGFLREL